MTQSMLVIGGTGMLGEPVARRLCADGHPVRIFTRSLEKTRARFGAEYEVVAGDVEDLPSLQAALQGCQGVHINQSALPFFRYSEKVAEAGDPAAANALLGAPTTTLEAWCTRQVGRK